MLEITGRALFLHVDLPGQEPEAKDLDPNFTYPTMQDLGTNILTVLDQLRVNRVVGLGIGAGGNVITRFAMMHPGRVHGIVILNTTASTSTVMKKVKDKISGPNNTTTAIAKAINIKNVDRFTEAYKKRSEFLSTLNDRIKVDVLMVCGSKHKYAADAEAMHKMMKPGMCSLLKMEDIAEPMLEAPGKTAEAILLFCQGLGLLPTVQRRNSRSDSQDSSGRKMSMEQYDTPNIRRLSLTAV
jgi:pimeloyl-ACP methyl ester carboxylesterase